MATRTSSWQSEHDDVVHAAGQIYRAKGKHVWVNPGSQRNMAWNERYIDVIAADSQKPDRAWVTEVETADSVSDTEAKSQWNDYAQVYKKWHLAVPVKSENEAKELLKKHGISKCAVITWWRYPNGTYSFSSLPGLS